MVTNRYTAKKIKILTEKSSMPSRRNEIIAARAPISPETYLNIVVSQFVATMTISRDAVSDLR